MGYLEKLIDIYGGVDETCIHIEEIIDSLDRSVNYNTISIEEGEMRKGLLNEFKNKLLNNKL